MAPADDWVVAGVECWVVADADSGVWFVWVGNVYALAAAPEFVLSNVSAGYVYFVLECCCSAATEADCYLDSAGAEVAAVAGSVVGD